MVEYLETRIVERYQTPETPRYGMTVDGYTKRSGAPTSWMIRLEGENCFRRLMVWQFSNAGTCFVRVKGVPLVVHEYELPEPSPAPVKFRTLRIGQTFDFIGHEPLFNSFLSRCVKVSPRQYEWEGANGKTLRASVGTISVRVYHVDG